MRFLKNLCALTGAIVLFLAFAGAMDIGDFKLFYGPNGSVTCIRNGSPEKP